MLIKFKRHISNYVLMHMRHLVNQATKAKLSEHVGFVNLYTAQLPLMAIFQIR